MSQHFGDRFTGFSVIEHIHTIKFCGELPEVKIILKVTLQEMVFYQIFTWKHFVCEIKLKKSAMPNSSML
jgi:hypothetical protein